MSRDSSSRSSSSRSSSSSSSSSSCSSSNNHRSSSGGGGGGGAITTAAAIANILHLLLILRVNHSCGRGNEPIILGSQPPRLLRVFSQNGMFCLC